MPASCIPAKSSSTTLDVGNWRWSWSGAKGPYRVTPNLMVVIPTSTHVKLHYGYTPVDGLGYLLTLGGIALAVAFVRYGPVRFDDPQPDVEPADVADRLVSADLDSE